MTGASSEIPEIFSKRLRLRVCGLCWQDESLLMVNHKRLYQHDFWAPPGGGVEYGESASNALEREFLEETGLEVTAGPLLFVCEFIKPPLHAVELFFTAEANGGRLVKGYDPEMEDDDQLIDAVTFMPFEEIRALQRGTRHGVFDLFETAKSLKKASGYWKI